MHFVNWFSDRVTSGTIGGTSKDFVALNLGLIAQIQSLYQPGNFAFNVPSCNARMAWTMLAPAEGMPTSTVGIPDATTCIRLMQQLHSGCHGPQHPLEKLGIG
jgi:hypothetical protein